MNLETAQATTKQWYSKAAEPSLTYLLEKFSVINNQGIRFYRPFIVAAYMVRAESKRLIKADVAAWEYQESAFKALLDLQSIDDTIFQKQTGLLIPEEISVRALESESFSIGINII